MKPWQTLERVETPAGRLELRQRGERDFLITIDGRVLMTSTAHRSEDDLGTFFPQDVSGGAGGEGLRDALGIAGRRPSDHARRRGRGAQASDQLGAGRALQTQVDHDHVRTRPGGRFDRTEGVGRDLDLEVGRCVEHVVLQACDLVRRVEEQNGGHLLGISADPLAG